MGAILLNVECTDTIGGELNWMMKSLNLKNNSVIVLLHYRQTILLFDYRAALTQYVLYKVLYK